MPSKARIISPKNESFDHYIRTIIDRGQFGIESDYFGIEDVESADFIRRKMKTAGRHMDPPVAVKSYWKQCAGCKNGGDNCRYHVLFTVYEMDAARNYKAGQQQNGRQ